MEKFKHIKIAVDLDGVIWDIVNPWVEWYNKKYYSSLSYEDITSYDIREFFVCSVDPYEPLKDPIFWLNLPVYAESKEALYKLNEMFDLYIATSTSYKTPVTKLSRFFSLFPFINENQLITIHNKKLLNVDFLIDDCIDNLSGGTYNNIIIDTPYNKDYEDAERVSNLKEAFYYLNEWAQLQEVLRDKI